MKSEEVRALAAADVDHLQVLARPHLVGPRRGTGHLEVESRLGKRLRQDRLRVVARARASHLDEDLGSRDAALDDGLALRNGHRRDSDAVDVERLLGSGRRLRTEEVGDDAELTRDEVCALGAVHVAHDEAVARLEGDDRRRARRNAVRLPRRVARKQPCDDHELAAAGSFAACSSASASSCSASSRLPFASSFLSSFSTARRL